MRYRLAHFPTQKRKRSDAGAEGGASQRPETDDGEQKLHQLTGNSGCICTEPNSAGKLGGSFQARAS